VTEKRSSLRWDTVALLAGALLAFGNLFVHSGEITTSTQSRASAAASTRLDFQKSVALHTSPTLGQPGDIISAWVFDPTRARAYDIAYPVKYAVADLNGNRIATLSTRTNSPGLFQTRTWPAGGYLVTAEIGPPGSGTIQLARHVYLGDFEAAVDRFVREALVGADRRSRAGMTLAYCVSRLDVLRNDSAKPLDRSSDEIIEYFGWLQELRARRSSDDTFRDRRGSHVRAYWSEIDASPQYYAIHVPKAYERGRPTALVVSLHGYDPANSDYAARSRLVGQKVRQLAEQYGYIVLEPFGRGNTFYCGIGEDDVLHTVEEVSRDYDIDRDRIYLMGYSMGGSGTWNLGTWRTDRFAALAPVYGRSDYLLQLKPDVRATLTARETFLAQRMSPLCFAENLLHTPVFANHGDRDDLVQVEHSRAMVQALERLGYDVRYWEHPGLGHGGLPIENALFHWFDRYRRAAAPAHVRLKTGWLKQGTMNWLRIERFEQLFEFATVEARIASDNLVSIQSTNVSAMSLSPPAELVKAERPLDVVWNGRMAEVERVGDRLWRLISPDTPKEALTAPLRKAATLEGPMSDIWMAPFLIVQGTQSPDPQMRAIVESEARNVAGRWREWQHATPRIKRDTDVTTSETLDYHLIVVGGPEENFITRQILADLPIRVASDSIEFFGEKFVGRDLGLAAIYPNPANPSRYARLLLATSPAGLFGLDARCDEQFDFYLTDGRTVFEGGGRSAAQDTQIRRTMVAAGFFDQEWQYRPQYVMAGNDPMRRQVRVPHRAPLYPSVAEAPTNLSLSDLLPARQSGAFRDMALDRCTFGEPLHVGNRRTFGGNTYSKGIAAQVGHARNFVEYDLAGQYKRFRAVVGLQRPEKIVLSPIEVKNTQVKFTVMGDEKTLWQSPPMTWDSPPVEVDLDIRGVRTLSLAVQNAINWHYRADSANWCDARVER